MKYQLYTLISFVVSAILLVPFIFFTEAHQGTEEIKEKEGPAEWFIMQRAYPYGKIDYSAFPKSLEARASMHGDNSVRDYLQWEQAGPVNIGGRVQDIEMDPTNTDIIYVGSASGGIFKSIDGGSNWVPIFDAQPSQSIGDIAISSTDPNLIYAGTGEPNCGGGSVTYDGAGVFKSTDAGATWNYVGLDSTRNTGRICIDPKDNDRVFVATMGDLFSNTTERGVYRTLDGGQTWEQVLFLSDSTGAIDLAIHPENTDTIYACMWERIRRFTYQQYYGVTCGIYRSYDGGDTWTQLTNGLPSSSNGRIGIDICQSDPDVLYSIYTAASSGSFKGIYKTTDGGDTWDDTNDNGLSGMFASYGWWFGRIEVDPTNPNIAFAIGFDTYRTTNGGGTWQYVSGSMHVDHHTLFIHPTNNQLIFTGNDGGVYKSTNGGTSWSHFENLPNIQFYTCEIDFTDPTNLYGGTQDNGTNRTETGSLDDWENIIGGDGFYILVDPSNPVYQYGESQYGALVRSTNGGNSFFGATTGISFSERRNWNSPIAMNPQNPKSLYFGTQKVYKTLNRAQNWSAISPDLTNGYTSSNVTYATVVTIAASPIDSNIILAGTDDGNVWVTENNGGNWTKISDSLPDRWITRVVCDPFDPNTAYVTLSGYRFADEMSHVYRTTNLGQTWESISGNLPDVPCNDLIVDPELDSTLYLANDAGVFYTSNLGSEWFVLGYDLPLTPVTDLSFHVPTRKLVAATYGRSMYALDLSLFTQVADVDDSDFTISAFPNPVGEELTVTINSISEKNCELQLFDMRGNLIWEGRANIQQGEAIVRLAASELMKNRDSGVYLLNVVAGDQSCVKKLFF